MKGDRVEIVIDAGGTSRTYEVAATRAGRRVDACSSPSVTEEYDYARQWMSTFRTSPLHSLE